MGGSNHYLFELQKEEVMMIFKIIDMSTKEMQIVYGANVKIGMVLILTLTSPSRKEKRKKKNKEASTEELF